MRSVEGDRQTPGHEKIFRADVHSSWDWHIHSLTLKMSCKKQTLSLSTLLEQFALLFSSLAVTVLAVTNCRHA